MLNLLTHYKPIKCNSTVPKEARLSIIGVSPADFQYLLSLMSE